MAMPNDTRRAGAAGRSRGPSATVLDPPHPERTCWGCDKYCPAEALRCGNGTIRTPHPKELFGDDWQAWRG